MLIQAKKRINLAINAATIVNKMIISNIDNVI